MIVESIKFEYQRYKSLAEGALAQIKDDDVHKVLGEDGNSIAVTMNHLSGNLKSRFTNFLTEDGEKPWRNRDEEFEEKLEDRAVLLKRWDESWSILFDEINSLKDSDLSKVVKIRGKDSTVSDALHRSLAHLAYHVGQIVLIARAHVGAEWQSLSIPRGKSQEYNLNPTNERRSS
ncbi:MAG: DinB family protein [Pyrinomonadaceae bacterium]